MKIIIDLLHPAFISLMKEKGVVKSNTEWRRLVEGGAIDFRGLKLRVGKHRFVEII